MDRYRQLDSIHWCIGGHWCKHWPPAIAFCHPSKHRRALEHIDIVVRSGHAKESVPNPEISRSHGLKLYCHQAYSYDKYKGSSSTSNAYNLCYQASPRTPYWHSSTTTVLYRQLLALLSTPAQTQLWQPYRIYTWTRGRWTHTSGHTHQWDRRGTPYASIQMAAVHFW